MANKEESGTAERGDLVCAVYSCHPGGMENNETASMALLPALVKWWKSRARRHTLRLVVAPETIGPLAYLSQGDRLAQMRARVKAGFTMTCMGGGGGFYIQKGRAGNYAWRIANAVRPSATVLDWEDRASDERQWSAPGVDLPWATIFKTHPTDPDFRHRYHSSADSSYVTEAQLQESFELMRSILEAIEADRRYMVTTIGEPQMSKRGLMPTLSRTGSTNGCRNLMTTLSYCDGASVLENALTQGRPFGDVRAEIEVLEEHGLVKEVP